MSALIVMNNEIIAAAHNLVETTKDPTAHAEMLAIRQAQQKRGTKFLESASIYVTLEPCPMCTHAIYLSHIKAVYFGAYDPKVGNMDHTCAPLRTRAPATEIYGGFEEHHFSHELKTFYAGRRGQ